MHRIFLLAVAVLALSACSALRPLALPDALSFCNTADGGGGSGGDDSGPGVCREQLEICSLFFDPLASGAWNRTSCLEQCKQAWSSLYHKHIMDDCRAGVERANDLCQEYCRSSFSQ